MEFNFNNNPPGLTLVPPVASDDQVTAEKPAVPAAMSPTAGMSPAATTSPDPAHLRHDSGGQATSETSAAFVRFRSCRWHQPPEHGNTEFCTHREVKPYAGTGGFDADAWCPDCQYYKLRRAPRKRDSNDYSY